MQLRDQFGSLSPEDQQEAIAKLGEIGDEGSWAPEEQGPRSPTSFARRAGRACSVPRRTLKVVEPAWSAPALQVEFQLYRVTATRTTVKA